MLVGMGTARAQSFPEFPVVNIQETSFPKDTFDIQGYGAKIGLLNTQGIQQAIDACHQQGGGVVLVPAGLWFTGPIVLKSNVNLHLAENALLQFTDDFDQYPLVATSWEGIEQMRNQSPIWAKGAQNIAITGKGIIDGNGDAWRMVKKGKLTESQWKKLVAKGGVLNEKKDTWYPSESSLKGSKYQDPGELSNDKNQEFYQEIKDFLRPNLILLESCKQLLLEGVTFQNSPAWNIHPLMSEDIVVRNVNVRNPWYSQNGDGIDIESCRNVLVENSQFDVGDDAICIKSGKNEAGRKRAMPTENVWIRNNTVYHGHGGVVIGSEMSGGVKNLYVSNCTFLGTDIGLRFKTARGRGGIVEDIYIKNIYMKDIPGEAILFDMYYEAKDPLPLEGEGRTPPKVQTLPVTDATPQFKNFYLYDIFCDGAQKAFFVRGVPEMHVKNITAEKLYIKAEEGLDIQEASNIVIRDSYFEIKSKDNLIYLLNSDHVVFDKVRSPSPVAYLVHVQGERSQGIVLRNLDVYADKVKTDYGAPNGAINSSK
ncbi:glycoside hydrolase family 28 protein [Olivibacter sitiensis]|uniref:glycoside hydrolase family 28 protein n=1 Tax=Olivibacter sitiensis TaxID=376470 RepID=UPI00055CA6EA|nr:glycoside hydrolase family 28 protein [Olivibacter sitiensis]